MKRLVYFMVLAIFATQCTVSAINYRRRRADENATANQDTGIVTMLGNGVGLMEGLPLVGGGMEFMVTWISNTMNAFQDLTNGGVAQVLGGALPCVMSIENGFKCSGITDENNMAVLIMGIVKQLPLPEMADTFSSFMLKTFLNPVVNMMLGGTMLQSGS